VSGQKSTLSYIPQWKPLNAALNTTGWTHWKLEYNSLVIELVECMHESWSIFFVLYILPASTTASLQCNCIYIYIGWQSTESTDCDSFDTYNLEIYLSTFGCRDNINGISIGFIQIQHVLLIKAKANNFRLLNYFSTLSIFQNNRH
jgi:hypothetical protein